MPSIANTFPVQAIMPVAQIAAATAINVTPPLFGLGILVTVLMMFKLLLSSLLRAMLNIFKPSLSLEERASRHNPEYVKMINRMASELETSQPSTAAELRLLVSRH
jgi:hypothetical protein